MRYLSLLAALLVAFALIGSCRSAPPSAPGPTYKQPTAPPRHTHETLSGADRLDAKRGPRVAAVRAEPELRIRIAQSSTQATLGEPGRVTVGPGSRDTGRANAQTFEAPLRIRHDKQGFVLTQPDGTSVRWRLSTLSVAGSRSRVALDDHPYPGRIELVARQNQAGQYTGQFDAVNHVGMEAYLPGVLSKELYASWDAEAYRAQAIAARSYAIWEKTLPNRQQGHFDLEASQASQAYVGDKASDKARGAVAATRGRVLVFDGRVLPAFYSSCSGGVGQDAVAAWPGKVDDLAPLRGRTHGNWGNISPRFQWGPVERDRVSLSRRLAAWGRAEEHPIAALATITTVRVSATNSAGRPTKVRVTDDAGRTYELFAEQLRMAANFRAPGLPAIDSTNMIFSSNADFAVSTRRVRITGKGFGHGVGMCQFGAQHMATQGHGHGQILGFYYPGANIKQIY